MGIVLNQSFKNITTTYLGFGIGAVNVLLFYPYFLSPEYYGLVTFLLSAGSLVWPIIAFGVHNSLVKFYSSYTSKLDQDKLLTLSLFLPLIAGLFLGSLGLIFYGAILELFDWKNSLVEDYVWLIYVIAVAVAYFEVFFAWSKIQLKSVFGNFMREVFHRACTTILLLLVFFEIISVETFIYLLATIYIARTLIMNIYAFKLYFPRLVFKWPTNKIAVLKYAFLMFVAGSVAMVLLDLDKVMIEQYLPIEEVSIYAMGIYIASVIAVPSRAMHQITYPMTAALLNQKNQKELKSLYHRSSVTLLVVGGLVFLLIICNVNELYRLIPPEYHLGMEVVLWIAWVRLYDNLLGNANSILLNSDYYRLVLVLGVLLAVTAYLLNFWMIPVFGIYGAAYATFIAYFLYNSLKLIVIYWKFNLQPFSQKTAIVSLVIFLLTAGFYFWEFGYHPVVNMFLKSSIIATLYVFLMFRLNVSEDVSKLIRKILKGKF
ncbi:MAG TPA: oligosaccharide flippase family protein [Flavobacteriaceae bacterium]|nr:oligosaccharide flippase family protein [Flavobacteriaceae bacterium]